VGVTICCRESKIWLRIGARAMTCFVDGGCTPSSMEPGRRLFSRRMGFSAIMRFLAERRSGMNAPGSLRSSSEPTGFTWIRRFHSHQVDASHTVSTGVATNVRSDNFSPSACRYQTEPHAPRFHRCLPSNKESHGCFSWRTGEFGEIKVAFDE